MRDVTQSHMWHDPLICVTYLRRQQHGCVQWSECLPLSTVLCVTWFIRVTWLNHMCAVEWMSAFICVHSYVCTAFICLPSYVCNHMCAMKWMPAFIYSSMCHMMYVAVLIRTCDVTHSYMRSNLFARAAWPIDVYEYSIRIWGYVCVYWCVWILRKSAMWHGLLIVLNNRPRHMAQTT